MSESKDKLLQAFNHMVDELHAALEKAEEKLSPTIDELMNNTESAVKKLYALTQDETKAISEHVKRDITHARDYMQAEGRDFKQWLNFDIQQVEGRFVDFLSRAADRNWLDFHSFQHLQENFLYNTGEICGPGTLQCLSCNQQMTFSKNSRIPPCPKCHHTEFGRKVA
jgi:ElaB/YqjD/DUF883 family membrane-anchored ribosome-binding protein